MQKIGAALAGPAVRLGRAGAEEIVAAIGRYGDGLTGVAAWDWGDLLLAFSDTDWTEPLAARLVEAAPACEQRLRRSIYCVAAAHIRHALDELVAEVRSGELAALAYIPDLAGVDTSSIKSMQAVVLARIAGDLQKVRADDPISVGGVDPMVMLSRLHLRQPQPDTEAMLLDALVDPNLPRDYVRQAVRLLARERDSLDPEFRTHFAASVACATPHDRPVSRRGGDIARELLFAKLALEGVVDHIERETRRLALGDLADRSWATATAFLLHDTPTLATLCGDAAPGVRAAAARALSRSLIMGSNDEGARLSLDLCAQETGRAVPLAIAEVLADSLSDTQGDIRRTLARHPSAMVRKLASTSK